MESVLEKNSHTPTDEISFECDVPGAESADGRRQRPAARQHACFMQVSFHNSVEYWNGPQPSLPNVTSLLQQFH